MPRSLFILSLYLALCQDMETNDMMDNGADTHTEQCDPGMKGGSFADGYRINVKHSLPALLEARLTVTANSWLHFQMFSHHSLIYFSLHRARRALGYPLL